MDIADDRYNGEDVETAAGEVEITTEEDRGNWGRHIEFVLATIGFAVGLGNVWRFPYLCQKNGGGAFLIPYFLCLIIAGIPIFLLELGIGQRLRRGSISCWNEISPYLGGVGIGCMIVSFFVSIYYNMIIGWSFYYMFVTMQEKLPYQACEQDYVPGTGVNGTNMTETWCKKVGYTAYYWYHENLEISDSMAESGGLRWHLCLVLLLAWVIVYSVMMKGLAAAGKVVYFTSLFPYAVLFIFLIRGLTLEGASVGIRHMFTPDFKHLSDPVVWLEAATQIFFSLSLAFGGLVSMASYNPVHNNCKRDSIVVALVNCGTSLLASIVVFAILGFKATESCKSKANCDIQDELQNVASGAGLTFIAFTEAITHMPVPHLWAILFFMMLITLGLGSMFGTMEGVVTPLFDAKLFNVKKPYITGVLCCICYLIGLVFCQKSGVYWLEVFNDYSGTIPLLTIAFFELIGVSWVYGVEKYGYFLLFTMNHLMSTFGLFIGWFFRRKIIYKFERDLEFMIGHKPGIYWRICWKYVAPLFIIVIFFASLIGMAVNGIGYKRWVTEGSIEARNSTLVGKKVVDDFPGEGYFVIILLILLPLGFIPGVALARYFGYCPYKSRGAAAINIEDDERTMPTGTITPNLSRLPLTSNEEAPDQTEDNDEATESLLGKRESVL